MDCARNWVGSPSDDAHRHLTKALEIGPELPPPLLLDEKWPPLLLLLPLSILGIN